MVVEAAEKLHIKGKVCCIKCHLRRWKVVASSPSSKSTSTSKNPLSLLCSTLICMKNRNRKYPLGLIINNIKKAPQNTTILYQKDIHTLRKWRVVEKLKAYKVPVMLNSLDDQCGCMSKQEIFAPMELPTHKHLTPLEMSSDIKDI